MDWSMCRWSKLRISDNNNNTDAAAFHRDLVCYEDPQEKRYPIPIYTCLCYLDEGIMEIIPGEDESWGKRQPIHLSPGDVLIFRSDTLHRGIFPSQKQQKHRRLIQLFECFTSVSDYNFYYPKILFVPARSSHGKKYQSWTTSTMILPIINYISFKNAASGYNYKKVKKWLVKQYPHSMYVSSDAEQERWDFNWAQETQKTNLYIYPQRTQLYRIDLEEPHHRILKRMQYIQPLAFYACLLVVPLFIIFLLIILLIVLIVVKY